MTPLLKLSRTVLSLAIAAAALQAHLAQAHDDGIHSQAQHAVVAPFDVVQTRIHTEGHLAVFQMQVSGRAGASKPARSGKLAGSRAFAYVWPTSLDPEVVGFEPKSGILALAVASHPDFDDTPLFDENGDGNPNNDGGVWHTHWVVLQPDDACGKGALKVVDIAEGTKPRLPKTWPGLPILLDSPGWSPRLHGKTVEVRVPFEDIGPLSGAGFDGVTVGLRVNADMHNPLLCVAKVFKVASGDLSLPGRVGP